jgi:hypothetical protein
MPGMTEHACNSSTQEAEAGESRSKPAQANSSREPISKKKKKNPSLRRSGGVAQDVGLSSSPSTAKKNKFYIHISNHH